MTRYKDSIVSRGVVYYRVKWGRCMRCDRKTPFFGNAEDFCGGCRKLAMKRRERRAFSYKGA